MIQLCVRMRRIVFENISATCTFKHIFGYDKLGKNVLTNHKRTICRRTPKFSSEHQTSELRQIF